MYSKRVVVCGSGLAYTISYFQVGHGGDVNGRGRGERGSEGDVTTRHIPRILCRLGYGVFRIFMLYFYVCFKLH